MDNSPLFAPVVELWKTYSRQLVSDWDAADPRHHLSAEITNRLEQLDMLLDLVARHIASMRPDPIESAALFEWMQTQGPRLSSGEITEGDYFQGISERSRVPPPGLHYRAFSEVRLFTETFYMIAWRIRQILNCPAPRNFPNLARIEAKYISDVRNLLIEHPEHAREDANYVQCLMITDSGPVLKSSMALLRGGQSLADPTSLDKGLFLNAQAFAAELQRSIQNAFQAVTKT